MMEEDVRVVQCGVQLMNYDSSWYSALNVLVLLLVQSRLHYHSQMGVTRRWQHHLFARGVGRDRWVGRHNLTEDADVGIRIRLKVSNADSVRRQYVTKKPPNPDPSCDRGLAGARDFFKP